MRFLGTIISMIFLTSSCSLPLIIQETEAAEEIIEEALECEKAVEEIPKKTESPPKPGSVLAQKTWKQNAL